MALEINGEFVDDEVIRREAHLLKPSCAELFEQFDAITAEMHIRDLARERVIEQVLLRQETDRDPEPISPEALDRALEHLRRSSSGGGSCITPMNESSLKEQATADLRLDRLVRKIIGKTPKPKPKELLEYYRTHEDEFDLPEMARAAHIVKDVDETHSEAEAHAAIDEIAGKLKAGAAFAELADAYSDCPGSGGDLGYFPRGQMVPEFDEVVFHLEVGRISPVFRTAFGFHIAMLIDVRPARRRTFNEVSAEIAAALHRERQRQAMDDYVAALRAGAQVRVIRRPR